MPRAIMVVFDGLNPELVTPELMPRLSAFTSEGARLTNHRPVFPSVTRLNAAAMVTGNFPGSHGLHANLSLVPEFDPAIPMDALEPQLTELVRRTGRVLFKPTLSEILAAEGLEYIAAGVGTSGQAFMHHPVGETQALGATIHTDYALPRSLYDSVVQRFGEWPAKTVPNNARISRITDIFMDYVLTERDPAIATIWFSEPDGAQHAHGPGAPEVLEAVQHADAQFGRILDWLSATGREDDTSVIVTCDHGQSTIKEPVPVRELMTEAGFGEPGSPGGVIVAGNGGSALFYIDGHDAEVADRLVGWLTNQPWSGPIIASERVGAPEGTLPASLLGLQGPRTPDLLMSFAWQDGLNQHGAPGLIFASGGAAGRGTHGSMSPWEFRTFTVVRGPDVRGGVTIDTATGHPDLAPTLLRLIGHDSAPSMEGRVIDELFSEAPPSPERELITYCAERATSAGTYRQALTIGGGHLVEASFSKS